MDMALQDRIQEILDSGYKKGQLARFAGVTPSAVTHWVSGGSQEIKGEPAAKLEAATGYSAAWIATGKGHKKVSSHDMSRESATISIISQPDTLDDQNDVLIRQYDTGGAMGSGVVLQDQPGVIKEWRVSDEWLRLNVHRISSPKNLAIVTGFGDSMRGMYNPGDPLLVDTGINSVDFDAVYFFRVENEGFVKRLQRIPGEGILVISENKAYRDWTIKPGADFEVFARVVKVWKGEDF